MNSTGGSGASEEGPAGTPAPPSAPGGELLPAAIWVVAGPTAVGKTAVGIALARRLGGEILGADSRQIYRGMSVGTSKPTAAERAQVPHHLLDLADPTELVTAADFARRGRTALADLTRRGVPPVVVGGSGLYLRALLDGLFAGPGRDPALRAALEARAEREGPGALHAALAEVDPESARRLHPNDRVRLVRALEVHAATGRPLSALQREAPLPSLRDRTRYLVLDRAVEDLDRRIDARTRGLFEGGLLDEAARLLAAGLGPTDAAYHTIGFREAFAVLGGDMELEAAIAAAARATRQFARRQRTWFRAVRRARWVFVPPDEVPEATAARLLDLGEAAGRS